MTRNDIYHFYTNKIDDVADEDVREKLFDKLEELDEILLSLDCTIDEELEYQEDHIENDEFDYNYFRSVINQWKKHVN